MFMFSLLKQFIDSNFQFEMIQLFFLSIFVSAEDRIFVSLSKTFLDVLHNDTFYNKYATPTQFESKKFLWTFLKLLTIPRILSVALLWLRERHSKENTVKGTIFRRTIRISVVSKTRPKYFFKETRSATARSLYIFCC